MDYYSYLYDLLTIALQQRASDLHISVDQQPTLRINGRLVPLIKGNVITSEDARGLAFALMNENQQKRFLDDKEIDFSYNFENRTRFRVNVFFQRGEMPGSKMQ